MSDMELSMRQKFALALRRGRTEREAAKTAGYASKPGPDARRCAELAGEESGGNLHARRGQLREELACLEFRRRQVQLRLDAVNALIAEAPSK